MPLAAQTQRFKQVDYNYDLISGKVNEVQYQAGKPDAFYHKYKYDADNRIIKVVTSKDSIIWDRDAAYTYYAHGPLARVEVGDNKAQGMDYAYTLQGWIKGVNSNLLKSENDIGNDGQPTGPNSGVAKDAYGYTLNYHAGDYEPIDGSKWNNTADRFEALTPNSDLMAARHDLFNGNIGSMVTTIEEPKVYTSALNEMPNILPQGTAYKYDQLNRLLEMKAFQNLDAFTNAWQQGSTYTGLYHNAFKYDANGNILGQFRANGAGTTIDSLTYKYVKDAGRTKSNRLYHVNDQVNSGAFTDDIDDQGTFNDDPLTANKIGSDNNYRYDEIGNLIQDTQEGIDKIEWTVYGKIKSITRLPGSLRSDLEFLYDAGGNRIAKIEKPRDAGGLKPQNDWITTYYTRDAQGNVMGIYKLTTVTAGPSFKVMERNLYGSSRLGSDYTEVEMVGAPTLANPFIRTLENKHFEGSNHLGNVLIVFSDRKIPRDDTGDGAIDYFQPEVLSANDYSPFGVVLEGRDYGVDGRYGFNGKEKDAEVKGGGSSLDFGSRVHDPRIGRWLSVDAFTAKYPSFSPYIMAANNPVSIIDNDGRDITGLQEMLKDPKYGPILEKVIKSEAFLGYLQQYACNGQFGATKDGIYSDITLNFSIYNSSGFGSTDIQYYDKQKGDWVTIRGKSDINNIPKDAPTRINIALFGQVNEGGIGALILTPIHELTLHTLAFSVILNKRANREIDYKQFKTMLKDLPMLEDGNFSGMEDHIEMALGNNAGYEKVVFEVVSNLAQSGNKSEANELLDAYEVDSFTEIEGSDLSREAKDKAIKDLNTRINNTRKASKLNEK